MSSSGSAFLSYFQLTFTTLVVVSWLATLILFFEKVVTFVSNLRAIERDLLGYSKPAALDTKTVKDLSTIFGRDGGMKAYFRVYRRKFIDPISEEGHYRSGAEAAQCFDKESIFRNTLVLKFYRMFPLALAICGACGTVLSIAGTFYAARNIQWSASLRSLNQQFPELMSLALQSSMPLVFSAIGGLIFKIVVERQVNRSSQVFYRIVTLLDEVFPPWTSEQIQSATLAENSKHRAAFEKFSQTYFANLEAVLQPHTARIESALAELNAVFANGLHAHDENLRTLFREAKLTNAEGFKSVIAENAADIRLQTENLTRQLLDNKRASEWGSERIAKSILQIEQNVTTLGRETLGSLTEVRLMVRTSLTELANLSAANVEIADDVAARVHDTLQQITESVRIVGEELKTENTYFVEILRKAIEQSERILSKSFTAEMGIFKNELINTQKSFADTAKAQTSEMHSVSKNVSSLSKSLVRTEQLAILIEHVNKISEFLETIPFSAIEIVHVPRNLRGAQLSQVSTGKGGTEVHDGDALPKVRKSRDVS